jgi:hypothetical protein
METKILPNYTAISKKPHPDNDIIVCVNYDDLNEVINYPITDLFEDEDGFLSNYEKSRYDIGVWRIKNK